MEAVLRETVTDMRRQRELHDACQDQVGKNTTETRNASCLTFKEQLEKALEREEQAKRRVQELEAANAKFEKERDAALRELSLVRETEPEMSYQEVEERRLQELREHEAERRRLIATNERLIGELRATRYPSEKRVAVHHQSSQTDSIHGIAGADDEGAKGVDVDCQAAIEPSRRDGEAPSMPQLFGLRSAVDDLSKAVAAAKDSYPSEELHHESVTASLVEALRSPAIRPGFVALLQTIAQELDALCGSYEALLNRQQSYRTPLD